MLTTFEIVRLKFRRDPEYRQFALQFLPHLAFVYLINYGKSNINLTELITKVQDSDTK